MKQEQFGGSSRRIMITGTHGFVGARAMEAYRDAIAVPSELVRNAGEPLAEFVRRHRPDVIINAAAISDIGQCQQNPDGSYAANVTLPMVLARVAWEVGAKLLSFSSDQVYTGCRELGPYREDIALPEPANLYARHKLEAEKRVLEIAPNAVLLRATWMYDFPLYGHANRGNFMVNTLRAVMNRETVCYSEFQYRGITYVRQVTELLTPAFSLPGGVYNYGSENELNMFETAKVLIAALGDKDLAETLVEKKKDRPHNLWMSGEKLRRQGIVFDSTAEGFLRCLGDYAPTKQKNADTA